MRPSQLYLETTVWNFFFADDAPEKRDITQQFFLKVESGYFLVNISPVVIDEISRAEHHKKVALLELINKTKPNMLELTEECIRLANRYLELGVIPPRKTEDALHAAIATCNEMDALISWNLKHLSNFNRMERINGVNQIEGYNKHLVLITPAEVSENDDR